MKINLTKKRKLRLYGDIYDDSIWLINLVENLLSVTRIEDGRLNLKMSVELIDEVTAESIRHLPRKSAEYQIHLKKNDEFLMAKMDVRLILQVIINLIDNALKYTPAGSVIEVASQKKKIWWKCLSVIMDQELVLRQKNTFLKCFTLEHIRLWTVAAVWDLGCRCVVRL